ncbi:phage holin family protein [Gordonia sp. X0973]|uniref:phage holin family protein n=1 Tax=Gordonia sp. X0973 TaxID=2742602 RepID=UPI000F51D178|nr:phage holin family protein [Gordonia sp. X0973]QKT06038.1 phage holin family protein [Gordonia sp. X0973]
MIGRKQGPRTSVSGPTGPVPAIPLSDANNGRDGQPTIGNLVKDVTAQASTLVRGEIALAKAELKTEAKKAGAGSGLLVGAGVMLLYTSLFFFIFLGALLMIWLPAWAAFGIVFLLLLLVTIVAAFVGYRIFRRMRAPSKTIESVSALKEVLPGNQQLDGPPAHPQLPPAR